MRLKKLIILNTFIVSFLFSAAAIADVAAETENFSDTTETSPKLIWYQCDNPEQYLEGTECGKLTVPIDWENPQKGEIDVQVYRLQSKQNLAEKKLTIVNFPSGPGASGYMGFTDLQEIAPTYDLIALDPRGVGQSSPVECEVEDFFNMVLLPPTNSKDFKNFTKNQKKFWKNCATEPAQVKNHVDAYSNAKDAEVFRQALNLDKINIYGFSYGTLIAQRYLALFGENVAGSILQGVMNPAQTRQQFLLSAATQLEELYNKFDTECQLNTDCVLNGVDISQTFAEARRQAREGNIPGDFYGQVWHETRITQYFEGAVSEGDFLETAKSLQALAAGENPVPTENLDSETLANLTENSSNTSTEMFFEVSPETFNYGDSIVCSDFDLGVRGVRDAKKDLQASQVVAPVVFYSTNAAQYSAICHKAAKPVAGSDEPVTSKSVHPTLLLSNSIDVVTPKVWAEAVQEQLGEKAKHIITDQIGHGGGAANTETKQQIIDYLNQTNQ